MTAGADVSAQALRLSCIQSCRLELEADKLLCTWVLIAAGLAVHAMALG